MKAQRHPYYDHFCKAGKQEFISAQGGGCFYCGRKFSKSKNGRPTRDHLFPRSKGYGLFMNKVWACAKCNLRKGDREPTREELAKAKVIYLLLGLPFG